jgi:HEAT repeat protein
MLARLRALAVESAAGATGDATEGRVRLAEELAQVPLYAVLSPLERLFAYPERRVKMAVLAALRSLFFKRSLATIAAATRDADPGIADEAGRSLKEMVFPHAFDPLARIVRESANLNARFAALQALAKIETPAAAEFLVGVLEHGSPTDRGAARKALHDSASRAFTEVARAAYPTAAGELRSALHEVLAVRGG